MPDDLAIQINDYDSYQAPPTKLDQLYSHVSQVPVIRIYGSIAVHNRQKRRKPSPTATTSPPPLCFNVLVHVHNFYPYIYVDCHEDSPGAEPLARLTDHLEAALAESFAKSRRRSTGDDNDDDDDPAFAPASSSIRKYIATVSVGKGTPIYGFQLGSQKFYKISLLAPVYKPRLIKLVHDKAINFSIAGGAAVSSARPSSRNIYEGHLTHLVQFLTDFNLFGCGWMNIKHDKAFFRTPILTPQHRRFHSTAQVATLVDFLAPFISPSNVLVSSGQDAPVNYDRIGKSMLELDVQTKHISNREWLVQRDPHHNFNELRDFKHKLAAGTHTAAPSQMYLSSLQHIDADLKYQCELRGSSLLQAPTIYIPSEFQHPFGVHFLGTGSTAWSNQAELNDLLKYAVQLNSPTSMDFDTYSKKVLNQPRQRSLLASRDHPQQFRTCFELVDYEHHLQYHTFLLQRGSDILPWSDYTTLFADNISVVEVLSLSSSTPPDHPSAAGKALEHHEIHESILNISFSSNFTDVTPESTSKSAPSVDGPAKQKIEPHANDESDHISENSLSVHSSSESDSESIDWGETPNLNKESDPSSEDPFNSDDDLETTQVREVDENILLQLTQKRVVKNNFLSQAPCSANNSASPSKLGEEIENSEMQIPSSFDPQSASQPELVTLDHNFGPNAYEIPIPDYLSKSGISKSFDELGILEINYTDPFYDDISDMHAKPMVFGNRKIQVPLGGKTSIPGLPISAKIEKYLSEDASNLSEYTGKSTIWEYAPEPPSREEVDQWLREEEEYNRSKRAKFRSQIEPGITQSHFKFSYNSNKVQRKPNDFNNLSNFFLEIHSNNYSKDHLPNPASDSLTLLLYHYDDANDMFNCSNLTTGILMFSENHTSTDAEYLSKALGIPIHIFDSEIAMINKLVDLVNLFDPEILSGYEVNSSSWGYLVERSRTEYDYNVLADLGRGTYKSNGKFGDRWGYTHTSNLTVNGRHVFNVWRILKSEVSITSYSFENVCYHLLHHKIPKYTNYQLTIWFNDSMFSSNIMTLKYYLQRIDLTLKMINIRELISRNVEHSRLIGIDFNSNFYRGSQFKVESILSRITKSENILLNSPSKEQVHKMRPIECIPLVMEPDSNFYKSPMVVLDFQSLYPSIMIAYNYCYSTLIAKLHNFNPNKNILGYLKHIPLPPGVIDLLIKEDGINVAPNGFVFAKSHIRKSILAKMLEEILNTRILVKTMMKLFKDDKELNKLYNARQLALKLIANVTYGYTSASFSGRMPNSDVSDAIVATGREILVRSIELIETGGFGAKVVYGDTDSLFVYFPGKSKEQAFMTGRKIAEYVTNQFPDPVFLKFEKVYHPSVLLSKKRYAGYKYEYEDQKTPSFEAKGIETVRRDGIPAQSKMVEKALRILFESQNLSRVKSYALDQFFKIVTNKIAISDFCFAKEVRYGTYKDERYLPPGAIIAEKNVAKDPRKEPQYKERVAYLVIKDSTKPRIKDRCITPEQFLESFNTPIPFNLDYEYYITRVLIPPLERIFNLIGADIKAWYREIPKYFRGTMKNQGMESKSSVDLHEFIQANSCLNCGVELPAMYDSIICPDCKQNELELLTNFTMNRRRSDLKRLGIDMICDSCVITNLSVSNGTVKHNCMEQCSNYNCDILYRKAGVRSEGRINDAITSRVLDEMQW